jgi:predicted regulator of Ras-like GTPase activity (Roadblock/LC7/MglB family)
MTELGEVVQGLASREGVQGVLLLSGDGLPIEHAPRGGLDAETIAALAASLAQYVGQLGQGAGFGDPGTAVLEFGGGLVVLSRAGREGWLTVLASADADVGPLLYELRQHRSALAALL